MLCFLIFITVFVSFTMGDVVAKEPKRSAPPNPRYAVVNMTKEDYWQYLMEQDEDILLSDDLNFYYGSTANDYEKDNNSRPYYIPQFPQYDMYGGYEPSLPRNKTSSHTSTHTINNPTTEPQTESPLRTSTSPSSKETIGSGSTATSTSAETRPQFTPESTTRIPAEPSNTSSVSLTSTTSIPGTLLDVIGGTGPGSSWDQIQTDLQRLERLDIIFPNFANLLKKIRSPQKYTVDCSCDENAIEHELEGLCPPCFIHNVYIYLTMAFEHFVKYLEMIKNENSPEERTSFRVPYENMRY